MATSRTGSWSALFDTAPSSPGSAGVAIPGTTWRIIVQFAAVTTFHTTLSGGIYPVPSWADITGKVYEIATTTGDAQDPNTDPVGQCVFRVLNWSGPADPFDFFYTPDNRPGTQCFIRWGLYDTSGGGTWYPQFSGIVDTVVENWTPNAPARAFELVCFDLWYLIAGHRTPVDFGTLGTTVESAVPTLLTDMQYPFSADWSAATYTYSAKADANQNGLALMNALAVTAFGQWRTAGNGTLYLIHRDTYTNYRSTWWVLDAYTGASLPTRSATILPVAMQWINSIDRITYAAQYTSPYAGSTFATPVRSRRFLQRNDAPGSVVSSVSNTGSQQQEFTDAATARAAEITYLAFAEFDTATAGVNGQPGLHDFTKFLAQTCTRGGSYTIQRRTPPAIANNPLTRVDQVESLVTIDHSRFRWQARHNYRTLLS